MTNTHPNIERLESLLNANPTWAVKITAPDYSDAIMKLPFKGEEKIWIHAYMVGGDFQKHITDLARSKHLSKIDFEIKKRKGSAYVKIPVSKLDEPKFSITINNMSDSTPATQAVKNDQATLVEQLLQALKGSQQNEPGLGSPETAKVGLSMPEFIQNTKNEWELEQVKAENAELRAKLDKKRKQIKQYESDKPKLQERVMGFVESNPEVAGRIFSVIEKIGDKVMSPKTGLAAPELPQSNMSEPVKSLVNFLEAQGSDNLTHKLYLLASWILHVDGFAQQLDLLIRENDITNQKTQQEVNQGSN